MKSLFRLQIMTAILAVSCSTGALAASNPYVGTWKKNAAESSGMSDPAGQETTVIRRHDTVLDLHLDRDRVGRQDRDLLLFGKGRRQGAGAAGR